MKQKNYVAYLRQSTMKQEISGLGVEAQREIIRNYLKDKKTIAEYIETESGRKSNRPKLAEALELCRKTNSILIVAKLDRLSRNVAFTSKLLESDVEIVFCDFPEANKLVLHIISSIAEYEAGLISQRTKQSLKAKKSRGYKLGKSITLFSEKIQELKDRITSVIVGQEQTVDLVLTAILANGHVLIEGVPGVAKTLLARLTARLIDADFSRVQFTPDLMPSDVLGTTVFNMKTNGFDFHQGPIFADIVLVDEINRAPAKTQSALFEVMEERQASIDGSTYRMGELYTILATQNPVEQEGTYKLPEAQLDRFLMKITMDYPSLEEEVNILERHHTNAALVKLDDIVPAITKEELLSLRAFMNQVFVDRTLLQYIALIVQQTRTSKAVYLGASPRASVAMLQSSKAYALLQGRDFVTPEDIKFVAPYVLQHRLILTAEAEMEGYSPVKVTQRLIDKVEVPK